MKKLHNYHILLGIVLLLLAVSSVSAEGFDLIKEQPNQLTGEIKENPVAEGSNAAYSGNVKIYMTETLCDRWRDALGRRYNYAFLDFSIDADITINDGEVFDTTVIWSATDAGFADLLETNMTAVATIFNSEGYLQDAYPGHSYWFYAHNADAAAATTPDVPGRNYKDDVYTHTVFLEEATSTT